MMRDMGVERCIVADKPLCDSLTQVLALKFGYANVQEMMKDSRKRFSLLENGILDQPSTRLLLVNVSAHREGPASAQFH